MPSAYDDLLQGIGAAQPAEQASSRSAFDDLYPPAQEPATIGYTRGRWQGTKPPSLSGMAEAFAREFREQLMRFDRGLQQGFNLLPFGSAEDRQQVSARLAAEEAAGESEMAPYRKEYPMATGLGQGAPYALMPQRALPAILGGALWEGLKYGSPGERGGAAAGGAALSGLGALAGNIGRFAIQPAAQGPQTLGLQSAAGKLGTRLSAGQASGDARAIAAEDYLRQTPFGSIPLANLAREQQRAVNQAAAKGIGEQADAVTQGVVDSAFTRVGDILDDLQARNTLIPDKTLGQELGDFWKRLATDASSDTQRVMDAQITKYLEKMSANGGKLPGGVYRELNTDINEIVKGGGDLGRYAGKLRDIMRRGMGRNMSEADRQAWQQANSEYRNLMRLTERRYVFNEMTGDVNPKAVAGVLEGEGTRLQRGTERGPFADIAEFGRGMPNTGIGSQTAPRYFWNELRNNPIGGLLGGIPDYLTASLLARGGLGVTAPWLQRPLAASLGYLGQGAVPGSLLGLMGQ
jgi:hypothetical protein